MNRLDDDDQRSRSFNGMTAREWALVSGNVWDDMIPPRKAGKVVHGATFPEKIVTRVIRMYSNKGDLVLDPFVGTGTTLEACMKTGRNGTGIELNKQFHDMARSVTRQTTLDSRASLKVIHDDCRNVLQHVDEGSVQLMVTSPPYANFIKKTEEDRKVSHKNSLLVMENNSNPRVYSDKDEDFGNLGYQDFLRDIKELMKKLLVVTKDGGYNVWIVKDNRDVKNGIPYISLHSDLATIGKEAGFLHHDLIIWDQNKNRSRIVLGFPSVFYTNQNCTFIVVLRKEKGT